MRAYEILPEIECDIACYASVFIYFRILRFRGVEFKLKKNLLSFF